jgi:hypothetical protein
MTLVNNSKEDLARRADASFKKEERAKEGAKAMQEYETERRAVGAKTERLRALRLAKEAADKVEEAAKLPKAAMKRRAVRSTP